VSGRSRVPHRIAEPGGRLAALGRLAQLAAGAAWERLGVSTAALPATPQEVTPRWLSAALGAEVRAVKLIGASVGTSTRGSLAVSYGPSPPGAPRSRRVFVKCTSTLAQRLMLGLGGFLHGEPGFYGVVRRELEIEAPVGYHAAVDGRSWRSIVVIEDVADTRGASFWQPGVSLPREALEDLVEIMARWHGATWASPRLERWRWLRTPAEQLRVIDALVPLADRAPVGARRARAVIPPRLRDDHRRLHEGMRRSLAIASRGPRTYLHGDLHVANTYRTSSGRMGVVDWQTTLKGGWAHDFAYLLITAPEPAQRRRWERELLALYLERLAGAGGPRLEHEQAWLDYRRATLYPYFAWTYTLGRSRLQPEFQPAEVSLTMIERITAAIDELRSLEAVGL